MSPHHITTVIVELLEWEKETGLSLPWPPDVIAEFEATGGMVDLETGEPYIVPTDDEVTPQ